MYVCKLFICLLSRTIAVREELKLGKAKTVKSSIAQRRTQRLYLTSMRGSDQSECYIIGIDSRFEPWSPYVARRQHASISCGHKYYLLQVTT